MTQLGQANNDVRNPNLSKRNASMNLYRVSGKTTATTVKERGFFLSDDDIARLASDSAGSVSAAQLLAEHNNATDKAFLVAGQFQFSYIVPALSAECAERKVRDSHDGECYSIVTDEDGEEVSSSHKLEVVEVWANTLPPGGYYNDDPVFVRRKAGEFAQGRHNPYHADELEYNGPGRRLASIARKPLPNVQPPPIARPEVVAHALDTVSNPDPVATEVQPINDDTATATATEVATTVAQEVGYKDGSRLFKPGKDVEKSLRMAGKQFAKGTAERSDYENAFRSGWMMAELDI